MAKYSKSLMAMRFKETETPRIYFSHIRKRWDYLRAFNEIKLNEKAEAHCLKENKRLTKTK